MTCSTQDSSERSGSRRRRRRVRNAEMLPLRANDDSQCAAATACGNNGVAHSTNGTARWARPVGGDPSWLSRPCFVCTLEVECFEKILQRKFWETCLMLMVKQIHILFCSLLFCLYQNCQIILSNGTIVLFSSIFFVAPRTKMSCQHHLFSSTVFI